MNKLKQILAVPLILRGRQIEKKHFSDSPIYIGGCGRSGTTLLLSILSSHKNIFACPKELNLFEGASIFQDKIKAPKFYRLYRTFLTEKIKKSASRYCEKSPANITYIPFLKAKHNNNFKLIHIVRDGRDVILSKHPRGNDNYWVNPERWIKDVSEGLKYKTDANVYLVKYEDLVQNYPVTIAGICNFLGIEASEEILNWHKNTTVRKNNALFSPIEEIKTSSLEKWKRNENKERIDLLMKMPEAKELLIELGYM